MDRLARIVEELRATIADLSAGNLSPAVVDVAVPLFDYGYVDSLSAVMLIERVRHRWGVDVSEVDLVGRLHTIEALGAYIASQATAEH